MKGNEKKNPVLFGLMLSILECKLNVIKKKKTLRKTIDTTGFENIGQVFLFPFPKANLQTQS